ncbi:hypothetical protein RIF29_38286 [Crotalaria pallida]|uniref:Uncharacterized protein n=1 Tax=Crotalaria pallida TaxID=3830 RepID=A0AAN9E1Z1_CROPI
MFKLRIDGLPVPYQPPPIDLSICETAEHDESIAFHFLWLFLPSTGSIDGVSIDLSQDETLLTPIKNVKRKLEASFSDPTFIPSVARKRPSKHNKN